MPLCFRCTTAIATVLMWCTVAKSAQSQEVTTQPLRVRPLALNQTEYRLRAGELIQLDAPPETIAFLAHAKTRHVEIDGKESKSIVVGPTVGLDQVLLVSSLTMKPDEYSVRILVTGEEGEERSASIALSLEPVQPVPLGLSQPPVILLNGFQLTCPIAITSPPSAETFGDLQAELNATGVVVYFFDNCMQGNEDESIEILAAYLAQAISALHYTDGTPVQQVDLVAHSMGGLIVRDYLAGLQGGGTLAPPTNPRVRKFIEIATPNFGSFQAFNIGTQSSEMYPGSLFLWNLSTWNQRGDDLRGVDALAIVGNGSCCDLTGIFAPNGPNSGDGVVSLSSASLGFSRDQTRTRIMPYCHTDSFVPGCSNSAIANINEAPETGTIILSFLKNASTWMSAGGAPSSDFYLFQYGGMYFAWASSLDQFVPDLTQVDWGTVPLQTGGDTGAIFYDEFVKGTGTFQLTSSSLGSVSCGSFTEPAGYYSPIRCKSGPLISSVTPRQNIAGLGLIVTTGKGISINGSGFGQQQCSGCQVLAALSGATVGYSLQVSSWSSDEISAYLPATLPNLTLPGLLVVYVELSASVFDSINIMTAASNPCSIAGAGSTNVSDVQAIVNEVLGLALPVNDLNGDGVVNVVDVQVAINSALGLGCSP